MFFSPSLFHLISCPLSGFERQSVLWSVFLQQVSVAARAQARASCGSAQRMILPRDSAASKEGRAGCFVRGGYRSRRVCWVVLPFCELILCQNLFD